MVYGHAGAAHLKAVAVTGVSAVLQIAVVVSDTVLDDHRADGPSGVGVEVKAVVGVIVGHAAVKDVALTGGLLTGKAVGVLISVVSVTVGGAVEDQVVGRPLGNDGVGVAQAADLNARVAVVVSVDLVQNVMVAGDGKAGVAVAGVGDVKAAEIPPVAAVGEGAAAPEVQHGPGLGLGVDEHTDGLFLGTVHAPEDLQPVAEVVDALGEVDGLAGVDALHRGIDIQRTVLTAGVVVLTHRQGSHIQLLGVNELGVVVNENAGLHRLGAGQPGIFIIALVLAGGKGHVGIVAVRMEGDGHIGAVDPVHRELANALTVEGDLGGALHIALDHQGIFRSGGGGAGGEGIGGDGQLGRDLLHGPLLGGLIVGGADGGELGVGHGDAGVTGGKEAHIDVVGVQMAQRLRIIVLLLADDVAGLIVVGQEIAGVVALDLHDEIGNVGDGAVGLVGVVAHDIVGTAAGALLIIGAGKVQRISNAGGIFLHELFHILIVGRGQAQLRQGADAQAHRVLGAVGGGSGQDLAGVVFILHLGGHHHILVGPVGAGLPGLGHAVPDQHAEALLTVGIGPLVHMDVGPEGKVLVLGHGGIVVGNAVVGAGLDLALAALGIDGDLAVIQIAGKAVVVLVGGRAKAGKVPHLLGVLGHLNGDRVALGADLLAPDGGDGDDRVAAHGQTAHLTLGSSGGGGGVAAHKDSVASGLGHDGPNHAHLTAAGTGGGGNAGLCQGENKGHGSGWRPGLVGLAGAGGHDLEGKGVALLRHDGDRVALGGGGGCHHRAGRVHHGDCDLVGPVITQLGVKGHVDGAFVDGGAGNDGSGHVGPGGAVSPGAGGGVGHADSVDTDAPVQVVVLSDGGDHLIAARRQAGVSQVGGGGAGDDGHALVIRHHSAGAGIHQPHGGGVAAAGGCGGDGHVGGAGDGELNGALLVLVHLHAVNAALGILVTLCHLADDLHKPVGIGGALGDNGLVGGGLRPQIHVSRAKVIIDGNALAARSGPVASLGDGDAVDADAPVHALIVGDGGDHLVGARGQAGVSQGGGGGAGNNAHALLVGDHRAVCHVDKPHGGGVAAAGGGGGHGHVGSGAGGKLKGALLVLVHLHAVNAALGVLVTLCHLADDPDVSAGKGGALGDNGLVGGGLRPQIHVAGREGVGRSRRAGRDRPDTSQGKRHHQ